MKASSILGLNARTQLYSYRYNKVQGKAIAASKIKTEKVLLKAGIPTPKIIKVFKKPGDIMKFDWESLPDSFALKPSRGLGGEGIIVIRKRAKGTPGNGNSVWVTTDRRRVKVEDLKLHILDVLEGAFSLRDKPDVAFIQEYVGRHKAFARYAFRGTPDIRVIVFNHVPVMAMLRLPTKDSGGRANLHQGAIGVGIDISTGITTKAIMYSDYIRYKPGTKRKLHGIKIPHWDEILKIAISCQDASNLMFMGVDVVLHPTKGPMVLELNYQPGFQIQLANKAGLKKRLERVEDLEIRDADHGVKIAKALFSASFSSRVKPDEVIKKISAIEEVTIYGKNKVRKKVMAKIDTGAWRTSVSKRLADELGLLDRDNILWTKTVKSSLGKQERPVISFSFKLAGKKMTTPASVAKRLALKYPVIIGRKNLKGILVDPDIREKLKETK